MGNFIDSLPSPAEDTDTASAEETRNIRMAASLVYIVGIVLWVVLFATFVGFRSAGMPAYLGLALGVVFLGINTGMAWQETIGTYAVERNEADGLGRDAFYLVAAVFSLATVLLGMNKDKLRPILPMLLLAVFFGIIMVMTPVWVSTTDPVPTILLKHIRTVFMLCGVGFLTVAMVRSYRILMQ